MGRDVPTALGVGRIEPNSREVSLLAPPGEVTAPSPAPAGIWGPSGSSPPWVSGLALEKC